MVCCGCLDDGIDALARAPQSAHSLSTDTRTYIPRNQPHNTRRETPKKQLAAQALKAKLKGDKAGYERLMQRAEAARKQVIAGMCIVDVWLFGSGGLDEGLIGVGSDAMLTL